MRRTKWALVVAGACASAGGARADAVPAPREDVVVAAGDKAHGFLRGGETHALQVHLAKGDVYSLRVAATNRDETLLLHATVRDPSGRDIGDDVRVRHLAQGKRVEIGPFRAGTTGTYVVELLGDGTYANRGSYAGASKLRMGRSSFALPENGAPAAVEVPAGATLRLRAKHLTKMTMALPGETAGVFAAGDALVATLRGKGLARSTTGAFEFSAQAASASVTVSRRGFKAIDVAAPTFPELPADQIPAGFAPPESPDVAPAPTTPAPAQTPTVVGLDASGEASLFFTGPSMSSAGPIAVHQMDDSTDGVSIVVPDPKTPPVPQSDSSPPPSPIASPPLVPPPPAPIDPSGIPTTLAKNRYAIFMAWPAAPSPQSLFGKSAFLGAVGWRNAPWTIWTPGTYPAEVRSKLLPLTANGAGNEAPVYGDDSDPFVRRTSSVPDAAGRAGALGTITTTTRYFVDGHQVATALAAGGRLTIKWHVEGSGTIGDTPWTLSGDWSSSMSATSGHAATNLLDGSETYVAGDVIESVEIVAYKLQAIPLSTAIFDAIGTIRNTLSIPSSGIRQTIERSYGEAHWIGGFDREVSVRLKLVTVTPATPSPGVVDEQDFNIVLC